MRRDCAAVIPFAVLTRDFELISERSVKPKARSSRARIVYVGAGGPIMRRSFSLLCDALADVQRLHPLLTASVQIELYGTDLGWREGDPRCLADIAKEKGVGELVSEAPSRVSYRRSLE